MRNIRRSVWFLVLAVLLAASALAAEQAISGFVRDVSGASVPGAEVTLTHTGIGLVRQAVTDDRGFYLFTVIPVGGYTLRVDLESFLPVTITGIVIEVGDRKDYPVTLEVFTVTVAVEVKAEVEQVETTTSQLDTVIDSRRIVDLPLNGRNPLALTYLVPGVVTTARYEVPSVNGARWRGNNYMLDGTDNNANEVYFPVSQGGTYGNSVGPNVDATAEFRVITSNPSAEYGRTGGAVIDVITRSGTNTFHGNAYLFTRADNLNANTWANNFYGLGKIDFKRHQFGGSLGGPIIRDRLFFFFNTEWIRLRQQVAVYGLVPTQEFRDSVTNPDIARIFHDYYPLPNSDILEVPGINGRYVYPVFDPWNGEQYTLKGDFIHSPAHSGSARLVINRMEFPGDYRGLPDMPDKWNYRLPAWALALGWVWVASPTLVNDLKVSENRSSAEYELTDVTKMGLIFSEWPTSGIQYFSPYGNDNIPVGVTTGTFQLKDTLTWTRGAHNLRMGIDFRWCQYKWGYGYGVYPAMGFGPAYHITDNTLDNIRAGAVDYVYQTLYSDGQEFIPDLKNTRGWRQREYDFFIQDDWRIRPNLALNLGLRYEWKPTPFEVNSLASTVPNPLGDGYHLVNPANYFDPANWDNGNWQTGYPIWVGTGADFRLTGPKYGNSLWEASKTNWGPRMGFSWDPFGDGRTAVRAGYGISYDRMFGNELMWNVQYPFTSGRLYLDARPGGEYDGVFPDGVAYYGHGIPVPAITLHPPPESFLEHVLYTDQFKQPYIQTWNVSLQRELWPGHILNLAYVGSAGVHLLNRLNPNQMAHPSEELIQALADNLNVTASIPWYIRDYSGANTQFSRIHYIDTYGHSNYNALQATFSRRLQQGLQFQANYTWSTAFDNYSDVCYVENGSAAFNSDYYNLGYDRGYASFDVRQVFNASVIWELPLGPGRRFGGGLTGWQAQLAGGWQVNAIVQANSGYPLDYKVPRDTLGTGYTNNRGPARPDVADYDVVTDPANNILGPTQANFYWSSAYINLRHPQGNYYRGSFRGPGYWNVDLSILKDVALPWFTADGARLQFRAEAFNLFNHTNWVIPNLNFSSSNMGKSYDAYANRQIQLGVKFIF